MLYTIDNDIYYSTPSPLSSRRVGIEYEYIHMYMMYTVHCMYIVNMMD
jgi:hypothetical protein